VNILNKQSREVARGGYAAWGLGRGLTSSRRKIPNVLPNVL
jgi:hypothetical protein